MDKQKQVKELALHYLTLCKKRDDYTPEMVEPELTSEIDKLYNPHGHHGCRYGMECPELPKIIEELERIKSKTWCAYCGQEYPLDTVTAEQIGEHIATCEKHPLFQAKKLLEAKDAEIAQAVKQAKQDERDKVKTELSKEALPDSAEYETGEGFKCHKVFFFTRTKWDNFWKALQDNTK